LLLPESESDLKLSERWKPPAPKVENRGSDMLAIDVRDCEIVVATPRRHGSVARMVVALEDAGIGVSRIEPRIGESGMYRLTAMGSPEVAVRILEGIGCRVIAPLRRG
jgi:hypothetical protein